MSSAPEEPLIDAAALAGLLADGDRLRAFAALVLGARTSDEVRGAAGLSTRAAVTALGRLVDGGLVVRSDKGEHWVVEDAFRLAARAAAPPPEALDPDAPPDTAKVLRAFVRDGRLLSIPTAASKRRVVLDLIAQDFEPGRRYSERIVNLMVGKWHADTAAVRRYLVDEGFLDRESGEYWRTGGTVPTP